MTAVAGPRPTSLIRERTVRAIVLAPHRPLANWLVQLDRSAQQNQIAFDGKAALLDVSGLQPKQGELKALLARLHKRNIPIMAVEGSGLASLGPGMPPLINAGSQTSEAEAELLTIDGHYKTADDFAPDLLGRPVQAWLEGSAIKVARHG